MADYLLRSSLNPSKVVRCTITFRQIVNKGEAGEPVWLIEIGTIEPDRYGERISPVFIHHVLSDNLDEAIRKASNSIADKIDWGITVEDLRPPFVTYTFPNNGDEFASIHSDVIVDIKDVLPAAGIDLDSIRMTVNEIDVTDEIKIIGDPFEYRIKWEPKIRIMERYGD